MQEFRQKTPLKSNVAITAEIEWLTNVEGLLRQEETDGCCHPDCDNQATPIAFYLYRYLNNDQVVEYSQRYQCKVCGSSVLLSNRIRSRSYF